MVDESVVQSVKKYLNNLSTQGIPVQFGVVFGSQVTGHTNHWSDIDPLVVSPRFDGERKRVDIDQLWITAARTDNRIEPIPVGQRQFEEDDGSASIEIARPEGQVISISE